MRLLRTIVLAALALSAVGLAGEAAPPEERKTLTPPPDMEVPAQGWASAKPNPKVEAMADNAWLELPCKFVPDGATSYGEMKFGRDYHGYGHAKTEVCLVYDEARNVTVWFGGCSSGYTNQLLLLSVSDATWYQAQPEHIDCIKQVSGGKHKIAEGRPHGQCSYGACYDSDSKLYVKGRGICSGWPYDGKVWSYDAGKNRWEQLVAEGPGNTGCYKMVYDRDAKQVVFFGGLANMAETWLFDVAGKKWRQVKAPGGSPPGRFYHQMVYDEQNKKTVLFGGAGGEYYRKVFLNDTWAFDSTAGAWTRMQPKASPSARYMGAMAYDAANGVSVLVGGRTTNDKGAFADTWAYDLAKDEWQEMKPSGQPPYFSIFQAAYDRINNVTVYPGGKGVWLYRYKKAAK